MKRINDKDKQVDDMTGNVALNTTVCT